MPFMRRAPRWLAVLLVALSTFASAAAFAGPRSGGSFGSRGGFRSGGGYSSPSPGYSGGGYSSPYSGGYGYGGYGYGAYGYAYGKGKVNSDKILMIPPGDEEAVPEESGA